MASIERPTPARVADCTEPREGVLTQYVAEMLRTQILDGGREPGSRIPQDALARQMGTSRLPVREALRELASEGLVVIEPHAGARVASLDPKELVEIYLMREVVEPLAVAEGARRLTPERLDELRVMLDESEEHAAAGDLNRFTRLDAMFHAAIVEAAEMNRVQQVIATLWNKTQQYRRVYLLKPGSLPVTLAEHRLLLDALERHAPEDAAQLHQLHVRRTRLGLADRADLFGQRSQPVRV